MTIDTPEKVEQVTTRVPGAAKYRAKAIALAVGALACIMLAGFAISVQLTAAPRGVSDALYYCGRASEWLLFGHGPVLGGGDPANVASVCGPVIGGQEVAAAVFAVVAVVALTALLVVGRRRQRVVRSFALYA